MKHDSVSVFIKVNKMSDFENSQLWLKVSSINRKNPHHQTVTMVIGLLYKMNIRLIKLQNFL